MVNQVIDLYIKDFKIYYHKNWYWIINPITYEWVVCVSDTGYTFFNKNLWDFLSRFYPFDNLTECIKSWVIYRLGTPINDHCHPDYGLDYDWRDEFTESIILDVINNGIVINSNMKLTKIQKKLSHSIRSSIHIKCLNKTNLTILDDIWWKIHNEIKIPNSGSIEIIQVRIFNDLQNEIN